MVSASSVVRAGSSLHGLPFGRILQNSKEKNNDFRTFGPGARHRCGRSSASVPSKPNWPPGGEPTPFRTGTRRRRQTKSGTQHPCSVHPARRECMPGCPRPQGPSLSVSGSPHAASGLLRPGCLCLPVQAPRRSQSVGRPARSACSLQLTEREHGGRGPTIPPGAPSRLCSEVAKIRLNRLTRFYAV